MVNRFKKIGVRRAFKKKAGFVVNPSYLRKLRTRIDGSCCSFCRNRSFYKVGWKKIRKTQFRGKKLEFNIGDYVFYSPFGYKEIVYPCFVKTILVEMNRGDFSLIFNLKRLDKKEDMFLASTNKLLSIMPENEAAIWKLKS